MVFVGIGVEPKHHKFLGTKPHQLYTHTFCLLRHLFKHNKSNTDFPSKITHTKREKQS